MDPLPELLTTAEVASITRAPVASVRYWRFSGTGPRSFRLGRRVVYRRTEVEAWLAEQEQRDPVNGNELIAPASGLAGALVTPAC